MFCRQRSESRASGAREAFTGGDFGLNVFGKDKYVELLRRSPWIPPGVELRRTGSRGGWGAHGIWHGMASLPPRAKSRSNMILTTVHGGLWGAPQRGRDGRACGCQPLFFLAREGAEPDAVFKRYVFLMLRHHCRVRVETRMSLMCKD